MIFKIKVNFTNGNIKILSESELNLLKKSAIISDPINNDCIEYLGITVENTNGETLIHYIYNVNSEVECKDKDFKTLFDSAIISMRETSINNIIK